MKLIAKKKKGFAVAGGAKRGQVLGKNWATPMPTRLLHLSQPIVLDTDSTHRICRSKDPTGGLPVINAGMGGSVARLAARMNIDFLPPLATPP
uniref:HDC06594 n=1 Tax=Drosophila melanogaster TaxID=7227 RepID=Q6IGD5_DROME|nr:TPA_inf: HDC06594 [Drosophila melanogaster]